MIFASVLCKCSVALLKAPEFLAAPKRCDNYDYIRGGERQLSYKSFIKKSLINYDRINAIPLNMFCPAHVNL